MRADNLGNIEMQPTRNEDGSMIYYRTDKGFEVWIDANKGEKVCVRHMDTGATVSIEGIEEYTEPEVTQTMTMKEAFEYRGQVEIETNEFMGLGESVIGEVVGHETSYDGWGEPCGEEISVRLRNSVGYAHLNEWEVGRIFAIKCPKTD